MKKIYLILAAAVGMTITSCTTNDYLGEVDPNAQAINDGSIQFGIATKGMTRADLVGDAAAKKLGGMFVVEGTKGTEDTNKPSDDVVFDNYLVGFEYNSADKTASNTNNWEYVGKQTGISGRMTGETWTALHGSGTDVAKTQSIKYWDYSVPQYDFIAWSTGERQAVTVAPTAGSTVQVTRINTGTTLSQTGTEKGGFTMTVANVTDLEQCYFTDIITVEKTNYNKPVTLPFKSMATRVRVALYETIPGYSVKDVLFYTANGGTLGSGTSTTATLFTTGTDVLPKSGSIQVYYPSIGTDRSAYADYQKASVTVTSGTTATTQGFGTLTANYTGKDDAGFEVDENIYLGRTLNQATFAGSSADKYYQAVFPNSVGKALTLRVDYTLVSTDGSGETITVHGANAVVPPTYTVWQPNYAYTYIFKINDNTNGWTSLSTSDQAGLYPITFDAVVRSVVEGNAEQTTVTTVSTPTITTYQQGHTNATNEYSRTKKAHERT